MQGCLTQLEITGGRLKLEMNFAEGDQPFLDRASHVLLNDCKVQSEQGRDRGHFMRYADQGLDLLRLRGLLHMLDGHQLTRCPNNQHKTA